MSRPTTDQWAAYQGLYDHLNAALFGGQLPHCLLNFSRHSGAYGFFAPDRWEDAARTTRTHEISINPSALSVREMKLTISTLAHEMCHLWQHVHGKPSRSGYHNAEWGNKMEELGLMPSSTAAPGGKRKGQRISHYIIEGGRFDQVAKQIPAELLLPWRCRPDTQEAIRTMGRPGPQTARGEGEEGEDEGSAAVELPKTKNKTAYQCPKCEARIWGRPALNVLCIPCDAVFSVVTERAKSAA